MIRALALLLAVPVSAISAVSWGQAVVKPDFSSIRTRPAAAALAAKGRLVRILLFPAELGGHDVRENVAYITPEAEDARRAMIATIGRMVAKGTIDRMIVSPDYKGASIIPSTITMRAHYAKTPGEFVVKIEVW